jgi:hypothetical protein
VVRGSLAYPRGWEGHARDAVLNDTAARRSPGVRGRAGRRLALLRGERRVDVGPHERSHLGRRDVLRSAADRVPAAALQLEPVHTVSVLQFAGVRLPAPAPVPLGLLQVRADHVQVEPARQGPLLEAAAALREVQRAAFELEEVVRRGLALAGVAATA